MECKNVRPLLDAFRTGELAEAESAEVLRHLAGCESCVTLRGEIDAIAASLKRLPRRGGTVSEGLTDRFGSVDVDGRRAWVAFSVKGLRAIDLSGSDEAAFRESYRARFGRELREEIVPERYRNALAARLHGESATLPPLDLSALTEFEQHVLGTLLTIPRGEVRTYEWLARAAGRPRAVRAVGNVMAGNPLPVVLPCHRVVPTSGGVGNYLFGPAMKRALLAAEQVPVDELDALARRGVRFVGSKTTKIFCFPSCRDARRIREDNRIPFRDASQARQLGFRPCLHCTPAEVA